jgi:PAS domain S-box-containing protein
MKTKILLIEHDPAAIMAIQQALKIGRVNCITETVQSEKEFQKALHNFKPDLILSNYTSPTFNGVAAFALKEKLAPQMPFIFVTESIGEENAVALIKKGATDFVLKERLGTLTEKINRALEEVATINLKAKHKQSEENRTEELSQNEAKFRTFFENSMDGLLLTVTNGEIMAANPAACKIFQMTEKEIIERGRFGLVDPTDPQLKKLLEERQRSGWAKGELTLVHKHGSKFPGELTSVMFKDVHGNESTSMIVRDITERKETEQALKASETFSTGILDSLTSHIAVINSEGTILKVNKSWETFAQNNNASSVKKYGEGANYLDACKSQNNSSEDLASKALKGIKDVLNGAINGFHLEYPCHSPEQERWFNMRVNKFESFETLLLIEHHDISVRKMAEQKLAQTTDELQQALNDLNKILDFSSDLICSYDDEGRFVRVNAASEFILGYKPEELIGKKYMDFIFYDDNQNTINADTDIRSGVQLTLFENRYIHKNGSVVPLLWSAIWDDEYKESYCIAKDTTEKKKMEQAFEIERQRFHDLYSQAPSCMGILKGPNHIYELANELYLQLIDKKDIIGKTVKEVLPELEAQGIFEFLDTVYQTGETFSANEMLVKFDHHGNGQLVDTYLNFIYQAHRNMDGNIDGILFFANDVTEQVLSRKKIDESKKRYRELIENLPVATYSCDTEGRIMIYNKAAVDLWGRKPEIGKDLWCGSWKIYNHEGITIPLDLCPMALALKRGKAIIGEEIIIERPNGDKRNVVPYPVPFIDAEGRVTGAVNVLTDITENKKAQQALIESEKKYRQIVETAQEGIWLIDENHKTTFVNDKMCQILEYTQNEMIGREIYSFMDEEGQQIAAKLMKRKREVKSDKRHFKYISKSGKEIWANVAANPFISETGEYKGSMAMVTDITEIKKAEQTLKRNEKKYRYLFENNPMPMWITDLNTFKFLDVNKMAILQYGYSREEFLSMTAIDIRPEEDKESFRQFNESFENDPKNFNKGIWNQRKKNGTVISVEIIAHEIIYEGLPARFVLSNDITDRKKAKLKLVQLNKELSNYKYALDETSIVGITDHTGRIIYANDNFCNISKYCREELIGQDHRIVSSGYHPKAYIQKLWETIASGKTWKGELKNKAKDGTYYWVDTTITPFLDEQGTPYQYVATRLDITKRKKAELNLENQNKELIKTNTELDRFVYSVSHDLRSPLTSILGLLSFIEAESQEPDTLEHAEMIHKSINRLDEFIKNILSYSRNNRTGLEVEKISIQQKVLDIVDSLQSMKGAKGILYEIDIKEEQPFYTDRLRFNNILENLISNAIKHHKRGISGRYIKITGQSDHEKLQFSIADNGIGIEPAYHHKIFDMFFRLTGKTDGSGIGLYIVKDTVEILQGSIAIQSEKGTGTTFIITLKNLKR